MDSFCRLGFRDAYRAGQAMADAFVDDPIWRKLFEGQSELDRKYQAFFETPVRHCLKYGRVYANSAGIEGLIAYVPGKFSDMTFWRMLRSGALGCGMRMGMEAGRKMADLRVLSGHRAEHTAGRSYLYLLLLGVKTAHQGKGIGGSLLRALIAEADEEDCAIYLETETEQNVRLYERFGFKTVKKITLEKLGLPMWEMMRESHAG